VTGGIRLSAFAPGGLATVPAGVVFCPPVPPPSTHIDLSRLAGLALAQGRSAGSSIESDQGDFAMAGSSLNREIRALTTGDLDQVAGGECHILYNFKINGVSLLGAYCDDGYWVTTAVGGGVSIFREGRV
jgi:hypothetical protein